MHKDGEENELSHYASPVGACIAAAFSAPLHAQAPDMPEVISPLRAETDHNGVNVVNGKLTIAVPVLSVPGAPNLRFDRVQNVTPYVKGKVSGGVGDYAIGSYSVQTGTGSSESFQCTDFDCQSVTGTGRRSGQRRIPLSPGGSGRLRLRSEAHQDD